MTEQGVCLVAHMCGRFTPAQLLLLMSGGTIASSKYKSSTCVGFRHPVIARHNLFSSVCNMLLF